jgi:glycosyltransferase involved in cell wall biosynthesis
MKVAFVVQRYGEDVNGGAEQLCRALARRLARRGEIDELVVFTTCARDHLSWANHYPPGECRVDGVRVERHPVRLPRMARLQEYLFRLLESPLRSRWIERLWLVAQGPYAPSLLRRIREVHERFDAFVFVTYLYHPTVRGIPIVRERAVLLATAHEERAIGAPGFAELFAAPRAIACLSHEEREFLRGRFGLAGQRLEVVGSGLDEPPSAAQMDAARALVPAAPYLLYVGRIEGEKGVPELLAGFRAFKQRYADTVFQSGEGRTFRGSELRMVLAGRGTMKLPDDADIVPVGFVSDAAKHALLRECLALVAPSRYESLSLVLLEAWQHARPVLANARCAVTRGQVERAHGGEVYAGADDLAAALSRLLGDPARRAACGESGMAYVEAEYAWPAIEARWLALLAEVVA